VVQAHRRREREGAGAVAALSLGDQTEPEHLFLDDRDQQHRRAVRVGEADAAFVPNRFGFEDVGSVLLEPRGAHGAADLLVGDREQQEVVARQLAALGEQAHREELHDAETLRVERAAAADEAATHVARERRERPLGGRGRHDVHVVEKHDRLGRAAAAAKARQQHRFLGHRADPLGLEPRFLRQLLEEVGRRRGVARWVLGVDRQICAEQLRRLVADLLPVGLGRDCSCCDQLRGREQRQASQLSSHAFAPSRCPRGLVLHGSVGACHGRWRRRPARAARSCHRSKSVAIKAECIATIPARTRRLSYSPFWPRRCCWHRLGSARRCRWKSLPVLPARSA
jgi:hypothetical protein